MKISCKLKSGAMQYLQTARWIFLPGGWHIQVWLIPTDLIGAKVSVNHHCCTSSACSGALPLHSSHTFQHQSCASPLSSTGLSCSKSIYMILLRNRLIPSSPAETQQRNRQWLCSCKLFHTSPWFLCVLLGVRFFSFIP